VSDAAGAPASGAHVTAWALDELIHRGRRRRRRRFRVRGQRADTGPLRAPGWIGGALPGDPDPPKRDEERAYATADITAVDATGIALSRSKAFTVRGR
jgi:hypothetical protein